MAEVRITTFQRMIERELFPDNTFMRFSKNGDTPNAKSTEIPQSTGSQYPVIGGVNADYFNEANNLSNASSLTPVVRINDKKTYNNVIMRPPNPFVYETLQDIELSYSKANQIASEEADKLNTGVANYIATQWQPTLATNIVPTTGLDKSGTEQKRIASTDTPGGYAGWVKRFAYEDLLNLMRQIRKTKVNGGTWYALPTPELWEDISRIDQVTDYEKTGNETMLKSGIIGSWGGIRFLDSRQNDRWEANIMYDITDPVNPTPIAYDGALNTNCVSGLLVWNDRYVEKSLGGIKFFSRLQDPIYMGDIVNWGTRIGAASRRLDEAGVFAVYEAPTTT